jgi:hypothetical protein
MPNRRLLYPQTFIRTVPRPELWDRRPLPNLIHNSPNREQEIERLERWYRALRSGQKTDLKKRLRSLARRDFWSAYAELMVARIARQLGAISIRHSPLLWTKRPDLFVSFQEVGRQIWEVAAAFQTPERERDDTMAHELASRLSREFHHRWGVVVDATNFQGATVSLNRIKPTIRAWMDQLEHGGPTELTLRPPNINCLLTLTAHPSPHRNQPAPIVQGLSGQGGNLTATDRLREVLRKKIKKYSGVVGAKLPLVVFLFEGDWLHIDPFSLEGALWGQQAVTFRPGAEIADLAVQEGGLFLPGPNGRPRNTRLSAVVYCRRVWHNDIVHATLNVYHHPAAAQPLDTRCFNGLAQCHTSVRDTEIETSWDHESDSKMLPLD